jgi:hypothetical protein
MQPRIACVEDAVVFLVRAQGVVAQALDMVRDFRPRAMQLDARLGEYRLAVHDEPQLVLAVGMADHVRLARKPRVAQDFHHRRAIGLADLQDCAQLLVEKRRQHAFRCVPTEHVGLALVAVHVQARWIHHERIEIDAEARSAPQGHLRECGQEAAIRAVVIGETVVPRHSAPARPRRSSEPGGLVRVRRVCSDLSIDLGEGGGAEAALAGAEIDEHQLGFAGVEA